MQFVFAKCMQVQCVCVVSKHGESVLLIYPDLISLYSLCLNAGCYIAPGFMEGTIAGREQDGVD